MVPMPEDQSAATWTPLGKTVRRWFPVLAVLVGLLVGSIVTAVTGSLVAGGVVSIALAAVLLFAFYVPPPGGWPHRAK